LSSSLPFFRLKILEALRVIEEVREIDSLFLFLFAVPTIERDSLFFFVLSEPTTEIDSLFLFILVVESTIETGSFFLFVESKVEIDSLFLLAIPRESEFLLEL